MELRVRTAHRLLRLERGSASLEGVAALAVAFLLLALVAQAAFAGVARNAAEGAAAAAARRASRPGADVGAERAALEALVRASVPGAREVAVSVSRDDTITVAEVRFRWDPPGPAWLPLRIRVAAEAPVAVPP